MSGKAVVWKFTLQPWALYHDLPDEAEIVSAGAQGEDIVIWAVCDDQAPKVERMVFAHPTGVPLPSEGDEALFVATVQRPDGLVFHVFDGGETASSKEQSDPTPDRKGPS